MTHFGVMSPEVGGHLAPMMSLARELQRRGHRITFYQLPIGRSKVEAAGFRCRTYGEVEFPPAASKELLRRLAEKGTWAGFRFTVDMLARVVGPCLTEVPPMVRADGVSVLLVDEALQMGATVAEAAGIPYAMLSIALLLQGDRAVPPFCTSWRYRTDRLAVLRNRFANKLLGRLALPIQKAVVDHRRRLALPPAQAEPFVHISQQPAEFEYPRPNLPARFHFVGPLTDPSIREAVAFPFDELKGRPLVYAALGTVLGSKAGIFRCIAQACAGLDVQLVISLGGSGSVAAMKGLPGNPLIVLFAPQLDLLKQAAVCITHAGMNTTLECLAEGVPMVAIPVMNDAPGVAARIAWSGCGEAIAPGRLSASRLRDRVRRVLMDSRYRESATRMREHILRAGGVNRAADLIENYVRVP